MAFHLKRSLDFNTVTMGLAAAGFGFASAVLANPAEGAPEPSFLLKALTTASIVAFALSVFFGILVVGRATKLKAADDDMIDDADMKKLGQLHSGCLIVGLLLAGVLTLNSIWGLL